MVKSCAKILYFSLNDQLNKLCKIPLNMKNYCLTVMKAEAPLLWKTQIIESLKITVGFKLCSFSQTVQKMWKSSSSLTEIKSHLVPEPPQTIWLLASETAAWAERALRCVSCSHSNKRTSCTFRKPKKQVALQSYQVGRKCVQMLSVSLVSWKRLRMQSVAELRGCLYPEMMLSSWKTSRNKSQS